MHQTIYALSTPPGMGGIAVIRISGERAKDAMQALFLPNTAVLPRKLCYGRIMDGTKQLDEAMAVYLPAPHTYTAEDVVEFQCHGSMAVVQSILSALSHLTFARPAQPGEFTKRAFLNGRIDLSEAEAVMDLISSSSQSAQRSSISQLNGSVSHAVFSMGSQLKEALAGIEASIDYPEEEWELEAVEQAVEAIRTVSERIEALCGTFQAGNRIKNGIRCAICGRPNAGKSSLFNAASGYERAIVSEFSGTTRDVLEEPILLDGVCIRLIDTAGLREDAEGIEAIGIGKGKQSIQSADIAIFVIDGAEALNQDDDMAYQQLQGVPFLIALNKSDKEQIVDRDMVIKRYPGAQAVLSCSAQNQEGINELLRRIIQICIHQGQESACITNARHYDALQRADQHLKAALSAMDEQVPADVAAIDVREALLALSEITGESLTEEMIDTIFEKFCLGK